MVAAAPPDERPLEPAELDPAVPRRDYEGWLEHGTMLLALLWWAWPLTARVGGRGAGALAIGCVTVTAVLLMQRPWRRVPAPLLAAAAVIGVAALLVCEVTPVGFARADSAVNFAYSLGLGVAAWSYARTQRRREVLIAAVLFAGMREFAGAFFAWWGHGTSDIPMTGDFPWRNSYAAFLIAPAVLGAAVAVRGSGPVRLFGWVAAPLCFAGIVFSTSRAAIAVTVAGWVAVGLFVVRQRSRRTVTSWALAGALSIGFVYLLAGPPVFPHRASPFSAIQERTARGETLAANGHYRVDFWHEAIDAFRSRPATGTGYQEMAAVSYGRAPADWPRAPLAHNSYLQPLADGGLLLGIPVLVGCLVAGCALAGTGVSRLVRRPRDDLVIAGAAVAGLVLMAHAAIDFDWTQPSDLAMFSLVAALALAPVRRSSERTAARVGGAVALLAVVGLSAYVAHHWDTVNEMRMQPVSAANAARLVDAAQGPLHDYRPAVQVLSEFDRGRSLPLPVVRRGLDDTRAIATEDRGIAFLRADVLALLGQTDDAKEQVDIALRSLGDAAPGYWSSAGRALIAAGDTERGRTLLHQAVDFGAARGVAQIYWASVSGLLRNDGAEPSPADQCLVSVGIDRFGPPPADPLLTSVAPQAGCPPLPALDH